MDEPKEVSSENKILLYFHCGLCLDEMDEISAAVSPKQYQQIQAGWTEFGLQVWCTRHNCNILNIDFEGQKHPANTYTGRSDADAPKESGP